jgi:RNA polymerase sigma factor (sigma-70 family)
MSESLEGTFDSEIVASGVAGEAARSASAAVLSFDVADVTSAMARGNEAAFRQFFAAYFDRLLRYLLVVAGGREDLAREALQGTLIRVARHVRAFPSEAVFWSWLTVLARSALIDEERKRHRYRRMIEAFGDSQSIEPSDPAPEEKRLGELLVSALADLSPDERELIEAKYMNQQTVREIAQTSGASEKAIESRLTRVRRHLRDELLSRLWQSEEP